MEKQIYKAPDYAKAVASQLAHNVYVLAVCWLGELPEKMPVESLARFTTLVDFSAAVWSQLDSMPYRAQWLLEECVYQLRTNEMYACVPGEWIDQLEEMV